MTAGSLTLRDLFVNALRRFGDRPAVTAAGVTTSYAQLDAQANGLAATLHSLGGSPQAPVALMMSNGAEYVIADQAVIRSGAAKVPLNDLLSGRDISYILRDSQAVIAIATASQLPYALEVLADPGSPLHTVVVVGDLPDPAPAGVRSWADAVGPGAAEPPDVAIAPDDRALLVYTGGTTGAPKGVVHLHGRLAANILSHIIEIGFGDDERLVLTSPLPHSAGFHLQAGLVKGAHCYVESGFDPALIVDRIENDRGTFIFAVPTMIYRLIDHVRAIKVEREPDLSALRTILYGAAPITADRLAQGIGMFGNVFMQLYGQSEAPNFITRLTRDDHDVAKPERLASCGRAVAMARVRIVDDDGNDCAPGDIGEVVAFTPYTMVGYHGLPEKTASTIRDGWLYTGDLGRVDDDGYLYLVDRKNDMIITGGMNVYSTEVENAIAELPTVSQVAVVGVPHPDWGEAVAAFVVATAGSEQDADVVIAHCRTVLSRYKVPKTVHFVDDLPVTALGKLDKKDLRQRALGTPAGT